MTMMVWMQLACCKVLRGAKTFLLEFSAKVKENLLLPFTNLVIPRASMNNWLQAD